MMNTVIIIRQWLKGESSMINKELTLLESHGNVRELENALRAKVYQRLKTFSDVEEQRGN